MSSPSPSSSSSASTSPSLSASQPPALPSHIPAPPPTAATTTAITYTTPPTPCTKHITTLKRHLHSQEPARRQNAAREIEKCYTLWEGRGFMHNEHNTEEEAEKALGDKHTQRQALLARIFENAAYVRAGAGFMSEESIVHIVEEMNTLASSEPLRDACGLIMYEMAQKINEHNEDIAKAILRTLIKDGDITSTSILAVVLTLRRRFPNLAWKDILRKWKQGDPLNADNFHELAEILKESSSSHPKLHFVWEILCEELPKWKKSKFSSFWNIVVDDTLFNSTYERKYLGFTLFKKLLSVLGPAPLPCIFSQYFLRTFINTLSTKSALLHESARSLIDPIITLASSNKSVAFLLASQLTGKHGSLHFDALTKTKLVETIIKEVDLSGGQQFFSYLKEVDPIMSSWIAEQTTRLLKIKCVQEDTAFMKQVLDFLIDRCYQKIEHEDKVHLDVYRARLSAILYDLDTSLLDYTIERLSKLHPLKAEGQDIQQRALSCIPKADNPNYATLVKLFVIDAYLGKNTDPNEISDLIMCAEQNFDNKALEVLTDLCLVILSRDGALGLRTLISSLLVGFAAQMTSSTMETILQVFAVQGDADEDLLSEEEEELEEGFISVEEEEEEEEEEEQDSGQEESDSDAEPDADLVEKIKEAMKNTNGDKSDDELSSLADEDMAGFDEKLAEIFKQKQSLAAAKALAKQDSSIFKLRVIGLLHDLIKAGSLQPEINVLAIRGILLGVREGSDVADKSSSCLRSLPVLKATSCREHIADTIALLLDVASKSEGSQLVLSNVLGALYKTAHKDVQVGDVTLNNYLRLAMSRSICTRHSKIGTRLFHAAIPFLDTSDRSAWTSDILNALISKQENKRMYVWNQGVAVLNILGRQPPYKVDLKLIQSILLFIAEDENKIGAVHVSHFYRFVDDILRPRKEPSATKWIRSDLEGLKVHSEKVIARYMAQSVKSMVKKCLNTIEKLLSIECKEDEFVTPQKLESIDTPQKTLDKRNSTPNSVGSIKSKLPNKGKATGQKRKIVDVAE